jgi:hypothetical protein
MASDPLQIRLKDVGGNAMCAWALEECGGPLVRRDVPVPTIAPYEVLVQVRSVGIFGYTPQPPLSVMSHEFVCNE